MKNFLRDFRREIAIGLALVAVPSFITWILPGGWGAVWDWITDVWEWLGDDGMLSHWIIILLWCSFVTLIAGILLAGWRHLRMKRDAAQYASDTVFGIKWRWRWTPHGIDDLYPFCPHCDFQIQPIGGYSYIMPGTSYACDNPECGRFKKDFDKNNDEVRDLVIRKIQQELRADFANS